MHKLERKECRVQKGQVFNAGGITYELMGKIGDGAAGIVRKARARSSGKHVAIKFLAPDPKYISIKAFDEVSQRFRREGIRGEGLEHENLVKIISYMENEDGKCFDKASVKNPFIVMEYVKGSTLESLIKALEKEKTQDLCLNRQTFTIAHSVCQALEYLHGLKITHRDVKPANVFISTKAIGKIPTIVKLGDFGVTKWGDFNAAFATGTLTVSHQKGLGTFKYMSPEQAIRPKYVTVRSDIFSLGVTLFELFTGKLMKSPHEVFEIMLARRSRGTTVGKLYDMGIKCGFGEQEHLFSRILDMFLTGPQTRPTSANIRGYLEIRLENLF